MARRRTAQAEDVLAVPGEAVPGEAVPGEAVPTEAGPDPAAPALAAPAPPPAVRGEGQPPDEQPVGPQQPAERDPEPAPVWDEAYPPPTAPDTNEAVPTASRNEVVLVGRVAAAAEERELPSGDVLATFRLVVDRPAETRPSAGRRVTIDTFDCAAWGAGVRRRARSLAAGDVVEVHGALRRRFWRTGAAASSRCEVEVGTLRRLSRAPAPPSTRPKRAAAVASAAGTGE